MSKSRPPTRVVHYDPVQAPAVLSDADKVAALRRELDIMDAAAKGGIRASETSIAHFQELRRQIAAIRRRLDGIDGVCPDKLHGSNGEP